MTLISFPSFVLRRRPATTALHDYYEFKTMARTLLSHPQASLMGHSHASSAIAMGQHQPSVSATMSGYNTYGNKMHNKFF